MVRMACATRPRRPIIRPMSPGATWMRKRVPRLRLLGLDHHGIGLTGEGPGDVVEHGAGAAPVDAVAGHVVDAVAGHVVEVIDVVGVVAEGVAHVAVIHVVVAGEVRVPVVVAHLEPGLNSSQAPEVRRSFSTRSVGWAPWRSHFRALSLSIVTMASGSAVERPRGA